MKTSTKLNLLRLLFYVVIISGTTYGFFSLVQKWGYKADYLYFDLGILVVNLLVAEACLWMLRKGYKEFGLL